MVWHAHQTEEDKVDLAAFAGENSTDASQALFLGVAYIICEKEMPKVTLYVSADDSSMWWVNGKELVSFYGWATEPDHDQSEPITLKAGVNVLRFAVINGNGASAAWARFKDKSDSPVKGYKISLSPPAAK